MYCFEKNGFDYKTVRRNSEEYREISEAAYEGNSVAAYFFGKWNRDVAHDYEVAVKWLETAAASGYEPAVYALKALTVELEQNSRSYNFRKPNFDIKKLKRNDDGFRELFKAAMSDGQADAMYLLGKWNAVVDKDVENAKKWFKMAADREYEPAVYALRTMGVDVKFTKASDVNTTGAVASGIVKGSISNATRMVDEEMFHTPRGHGFAAEHANTLVDRLSGKKATVVGDEYDPNTGHIIKNGADRVVNGVHIQSKYCKTGSRCISECFENGTLKYKNPDGTPMQIEVPADQEIYDAAVKAMEERIKNGEVPGVTDPNEAKNIVKKGHFKYAQAQNIAKAGTVESLVYDSVNGAIAATSAFGVSSTIALATAVWNGEPFDTAIKTAAHVGLKVWGTTFVTAVFAGQLTKAGLNSALVGSSEALIRIIGPKGSALIVNAFRAGKPIYGAAAMKSAAKLLRSNVITNVASVAILSAGDVINIFRGRISGKQLFKNLAETTASVAGGTGGWIGGAAAGAAVGSAIPIIGTAAGAFVGGILGAFTGGAVAGKAANKVMDAFIEDDADEMVRIIESEFKKLAEEYLLNQKEAERVADLLKDSMTGGTLKDMFASSSRTTYARNLLIPKIESTIKTRAYVKMPTEEQMQASLRSVMDEIYDTSQEQETEIISPGDNADLDTLMFKEEMSSDAVAVIENSKTVFAIEYIIPVSDGAAVVGTVVKGSVNAGDTLFIMKGDGRILPSRILQMQRYTKPNTKSTAGTFYEDIPMSGVRAASNVASSKSSMAVDAAAKLVANSVSASNAQMLRALDSQKSYLHRVTDSIVKDDRASIYLRDVSVSELSSSDIIFID